MNVELIGELVTAPVKPLPNVVINLSWDEAQILSTVCGGIAKSGGCSHSGQQFAEKLYLRLDDLGIASKFQFTGHFR